jgi:hypothetical protein
VTGGRRCSCPRLTAHHCHWVTTCGSLHRHDVSIRHRCRFRRSLLRVTLKAGQRMSCSSYDSMCPLRGSPVTCGVTLSMPLMARDWRPALHLSQANCTSLQVIGSPLAAHSTASTCRFDVNVAHYRSRADCESLSERSNTCPAHSMTVCVHCGALP